MNVPAKKAKKYTVAGLAMIGDEAPSEALKTLLEEGKPYVEVDRRRLDVAAPVFTPQQIAATIKAEVVARSAGELVEKAMQAQDVSLRELASRLGVVNSRVAEIRKAGQAIEVQTLARYAEALGYELEISFVAKDNGKRLVAK